jgi:hypothetical protein
VGRFLDVGHEFALFHTIKVLEHYQWRWSGMPIKPFLAGRTFEPEQIIVMSAAFADTCKALGLSEADHPLTPLVAEHVMGLSQRGVRNRAVLYLLTLEEFRSYRTVMVKRPHITKLSVAELREASVGNKK